MRILTFNHHESFIAAMAESGLPMDVVTRYKDLDLKWHAHAHAKPDTLRLVTFGDQVQKDLHSGAYDLVVCHTLKNLLWLFRYRRPRYIFVAHIPLFTHSPAAFIKSVVKRLLWTAFACTHRAQFVAVSEFKRRRWWISPNKAKVIVLSPNPFPPLPESASAQSIVVVGNHLRERGMEMGWSYLEPLLERFPITVIGNNPGIETARMPKNHGEFVQLFQKSRIYLYTVPYPWGDGYNTAMLEAMSMGMAVVTLANPTSPIVHEINGLVGRNIEELAICLNRLMEDPGLAGQLGAAGKNTVNTTFNRGHFVAAWRGLLTTP